MRLSSDRGPLSSDHGLYKSRRKSCDGRRKDVEARVTATSWSLRSHMPPECLSQGPRRDSACDLDVESEESRFCDYKTHICLKILMLKAGQELRTKLETCESQRLEHKYCRKEAMKAKVRRSQGPKVSPTHSSLTGVQYCP